MISDAELVDAAAELAVDRDSGLNVNAAISSLVRAVALTREEGRRHELAVLAAEKAGQLGQGALVWLRVALFALAA